MLDMGFAEDLEAILEATPAERQTVLFSATMPPRIDGIAKRAPREPVRIEIGRADAAPRARRRRCARPPTSSRARSKLAALGRMLDVEAAHRRARLLPHARRGRRAHRDAQRPRLPRRGAARRHDPAAARPRDGAPARRQRRPAASPPTSPRAGWTSTRSRTSSTTTCRPRPSPTCTASAASAAPGARASRSRSPSRASTAMLQTIERLTKQRIDDREDPDGRRPARAPAGAHARRPARSRCSRTAISTTSAWSWRRSPRSYDLMDVAAAAVKLAHEARRGRRRRGGDPRRRRRRPRTARARPAKPGAPRRSRRA